MGRGAEGSGSPLSDKSAPVQDAPGVPALPMPDSLKQTFDFHSQFNVDVLASPAMPAPARSALRVNLLQEELNELKEAIASNDLVEVADALADIQYVLSGTALEFGMGACYKELVDEVHRSNMSKAAKTEQEAQETVEHYRNKDGTEAYYERQPDGTFNIYRRSDKKTLKSVRYSRADIRSIVNRHGGPC